MCTGLFTGILKGGLGLRGSYSIKATLPCALKPVEQHLRVSGLGLRV